MKQALIDSRDLRRDGIKGLAAMTGNTYCGNLLWQSSLVAPRQTDVAKAGVQAGMRCCINKTISISSGTPRQAWLNYHDERNMNHKQTEM